MVGQFNGYSKYDGTLGQHEEACGLMARGVYVAFDMRFEGPSPCMQ